MWGLLLLTLCALASPALSDDTPKPMISGPNIDLDHPPRHSDAEQHWWEDQTETSTETVPSGAREMVERAQARLEAFNRKFKQALEGSQINVNGLSLSVEDDWTWHYLEDYERQKTGITPLEGGWRVEYEFKY